MDRLPFDKDLLPFVEDVYLLQNEDPNSEDNFPFYADGHPGIMYAETDHPILLLPRGKELSDFFLYGQTLQPISLQMKGRYYALIFQLYPFAARLLTGVNPRELNDDCFNLLRIKEVDGQQSLLALSQAQSTEEKKEILSGYIHSLVRQSSTDPDHHIKLALNMIMQAKGNITIKKLRERLYITERTFERRFTKEVGVTPKQFARIVQFNFSKNQLTEKHYPSLTELSYETGFSDQSHFIRTFKKYTGKTPKEFQRALS